MLEFSHGLCGNMVKLLLESPVFSTRGPVAHWAIQNIIVSLAYHNRHNHKSHYQEIVSVSTISKKSQNMFLVVCVRILAIFFSTHRIMFCCIVCHLYPKIYG